MKLTMPQQAVIDDLRNGRKMTYHGYSTVPASATWDDEPWTPYQKNWAVVVRALLKKNLVALDSSGIKTFHVFAVILTPEGKNDSP